MMPHLILHALLLVCASCSGASAQNVSINFNTVFAFNATPLARSSVDLSPSCVATGFPAGISVTFEWRFNGTRIDSSSSVPVEGGAVMARFQIAAPSKTDAGWYTCVASGHGEGGSVSAHASGFLYVAYQEVSSSVPSTFEVKKGQNVTLTCPTDSLPPATFYTWYRESTSSSPIYTGNSPAYDIVNASLTDGGVYVCRPSNGYTTINAMLHVFVLAPPVIHKVNTTIVTVGNTLVLNCTADSVHPPSYSWKSGDQPITNTSRVNVSSGGGVGGVGGGRSGLLLVRQVAYNDGGVYTCVATNSIGQDTADFPVVVQGPPYVSVPGEGVVIALEGSTPSLVCSWISNPTPLVTWTMVGGGGVSIGGRYSTPSVGTLVIGQVGGADEGMYVCSFSNALGNGTGSIQLVVIEIPSGLVVSNVGGHSLELQWNPDRSQTRIDQYVLEYGTQDNPNSKNVTFPGNSTTGMVWGLSAGTTYFLRLKAVKLGVVGAPGNQITAITITTVPVLTLVSIDPLDDGRSLQVRWHISDTGGVSIQAINVTVMMNGSVVQTILAQPSWGEYYLVTGLMPNTSYTIGVSASNAVGVASVNSSIMTPLAPPATPTKPSIVAETSRSISMETSISSIGSAPVLFILINVSELHSGQSHVINASINDSSVVQYFSDVTMTSLGISLLIRDAGGLVKPNTVYVFSVAAGNSVGVSHFSEPTDPASLVSPSSLYYIVAGIIGGVVAIVIMLAAGVLLYIRTARCRRGKRISINPHNSDSPLKVSSGYVSSQDTEKPETSFLGNKDSIPASGSVPPNSWSDHASQTTCDPHRGIPSPLNLSGERVKSRCDFRGRIPSPLNLTREVGRHRNIQGGNLSLHEILCRGVTNPLELHRGPCSPADFHSEVRRPSDFNMGVSSPKDFHKDPSEGSQNPYNQLKSPPGYPLDPQRSLYKLAPTHCSSPVSDVQSSPLECSSDVMHMADDVDNLSSPPISIVQGPRPSFRKLPLADKGSLSSGRLDGRVNVDVDVPCNLPFSIKDSLFELDTIGIPKTSYMTDV